MFIKKDTRKIVEILEDPEDTRENLNLARREAEFEKDTGILCRNEYKDRLSRCAFLSLYNNKIETLTNIAVFAHSPLELLNLGRNELTELPDDIAQLTSLRKLWIDDNNLKEFPRCILKLSKLELLKLSNNALEEIPEGIGALSNLQELALDNNKITGLPPSIGLLKSLVTLVLRQNEIEELPESLVGLGNLEELYLSSNRLQFVPEQIGCLKKLRVLRVNRNKIHSLPQSLADCLQLEVFNGSHNQITTLPKRLQVAWQKFLPDTVYSDEEEERVKRPRYEDDNATVDAHPKELKVLLYENPVEHSPGVKLEETEWKQPLVQLWKTKSS